MAADLEHVIRAAGVDVVAVLIDRVLVATLGPATLEGLLGALAIAPVEQGAGRPRHVEIADLAGLDRVAVLVGDLDLVAGHRLAAGAVAHVVRPVGDEDVEHLGRADAVEDVGAEAFAPAPAEIGGRRPAAPPAPARGG